MTFFSPRPADHILDHLLAEANPSTPAFDMPPGRHTREDHIFVSMWLKDALRHESRRPEWNVAASEPPVQRATIEYLVDDSVDELGRRATWHWDTQLPRHHWAWPGVRTIDLDIETPSAREWRYREQSECCRIENHRTYLPCNLDLAPASAFLPVGRKSWLETPTTEVQETDDSLKYHTDHDKDAESRGRSKASLKRGSAPLYVGTRPICDTFEEDFFRNVLEPRIRPVCLPLAYGRVDTYGLLSSRMDGYDDPHVDELVQEVRLLSWRKAADIDQALKDGADLDSYLAVMAGRAMDTWLRKHGYAPKRERRAGCRKRKVNGKTVCGSFATCICAPCKKANSCTIKVPTKDLPEERKRPLSLDAGGDAVASLHEAVAGLSGEVEVASGDIDIDRFTAEVKAIKGYEYLLLYFVDGIPDKEVAKRLGITEDSVRQNRSRALKRARLIPPPA